MKKRLILGLMALSLASGALVFGKPANGPFEGSTEQCPDQCCKDDGTEEPACCQDTEMCCE